MLNILSQHSFNETVELVFFEIKVPLKGVNLKYFKHQLQEFYPFHRNSVNGST